MSFVSRGAQRASSVQESRRPSRSRRPALRFLPHLLAAIAVAFAMPFTSQPASVNAACGTGWDSKSQPPETIKVLRTATDKVETVDFRDYVGIVMASGEWPYYLPPAALEVGATAVKQYAWYYALEGHHRSWYRTDDGVCYDVRDDTNDQLYKPERAEVKVRQLNAIEATWGLTLRKNGRFFLTGYLYGDDVPCAQDANGWKIFERSAVDCAEKGWDRQRIQEAYLEPKIEFEWRNDESTSSDDRIAPAVKEPATALREKGSLSGKSIRVGWSGSDADSGVARYDLERRIDGGAWNDVDLARADSTSARFGVRNDRTYRFRVRAMDSAGNWSSYSAGSAFTTEILQARRTTLIGGTWSSFEDPTASGGATRYANVAGAAAKLTFTGRGVAVIAPTGPHKGTALILINGQEVAVIDLSAREKRAQRIVFSRTWDTSATRTIQLVVVGGQRVDLDAVLVVR